MAGLLYIVPTPIGNLEDITYRAISVLKECDLILAEDTRNSIKLLSHFGISNKMTSYHQHNEHKIFKNIVEKLKEEQKIALISDAGTPGISDPGFLLVRECVKENIQVITLPGATAFVPALVNSGLPCDRFIFEGFLPVKKGRHSKLTQLATEENTIVLYESTHRILKSLKEFATYFGEDRQASVSREISKIHEETVRGTFNEIHDSLSNNSIKGEFVVIIDGKSK